MSRCQHGQPISLFCLSDTCNWREAGGCENCLKKYHTHVQNIDTINIEKLESFTKMFHVSPDIKNRCKILQEAVCNYFIVMKSQISTSLDAVSRSISNKLSFPYLYSEGQLNTFRKIKTKQYKKITKKELKNFCNFVSTQNQELIEFNEKKLYLNEVQELKSIIKNVNEAFLAYSNAVQKIDNSFNIQRSFFNKILEISQSINSKDKKSDQGSDRYTKTSATKPQSQEQTAKINKKPSRDRKVSIDNGMAIEFNRFKNVSNKNTNFDQNQKQIFQRKKKLFDMMNNPGSGSGDQITKRKEEKQIKQPQVQVLPTQLSSQNPDRPEGILKLEKLRTLQKSKSVQLSNFTKQQTDNAASLFDDLLSKGINLPEIIAHTILPREASKQKLYEDTSDVKQRKIKIPVKQFQEKQQNQSPLLKHKRQKKRQDKQNRDESKKNDQDMNRINLFGQKNEVDQIIEATQQSENFKTPKKDKQDENMMLKDREADSLALLLESLPLPGQKAIPLLEAALKFAHNNLSAAEYLSYLYLQIQKPKQCLELCNRVLEQIQESPQANQLGIHINNNKAAALNMLGRYSQSIGILEKCLAYTKRDIYYKNLGDAYFSIAIYEKASINYENAIKMNNHMEEAYYNLAVCYYLQEHLYEAKLNVQNALKLNPKSQQYLQLSREITLKLPV